MKKLSNFSALIATALFACFLMLTGCSSPAASPSSSSDPVTAPAPTGGSNGGSTGGTTSGITLPALDPEMLRTPLTLEAKKACDVNIKNPWLNKLKIKKTDDEAFLLTSASVTANPYVVSLNAGEKLELTVASDGSGNGNTLLTITCSDECYVFGNVMSLLYESFNDASVITTEKALKSLFLNNNNIINHPSKTLVLPATSLKKSCYESMFKGCSKLEKAPELPATNLEEYCYCSMFEN